MKSRVTAAICCLAAFAGASFATDSPAGERRTICLDGTWQVAAGTMDLMPQVFAHTVRVPGLLDMATPEFETPPAARSTPLALLREPSLPGPQIGETTGRRPLHYPADVQPVLDRHCVESPSTTVLTTVGGLCRTGSIPTSGPPQPGSPPPEYPSFGLREIAQWRHDITG